MVASLPIAWWFGALTLLQLALVGAGVGAATALFMITDNAYLPALIPKQQLEEGNAKLETTDAIAEISGPAAAGSLIAALGAPLAVAVDAVSYFWSALWLLQIREPQRDDSATGADPALMSAGDAKAVEPIGPRRLARPPAPRRSQSWPAHNFRASPSQMVGDCAHRVVDQRRLFHDAVLNVLLARLALIDHRVGPRDCLGRHRRTPWRTAIARTQTPFRHWPDPRRGINPVVAGRNLDAAGRWGLACNHARPAGYPPSRQRWVRRCVRGPGRDVATNRAPSRCAGPLQCRHSRLHQRHRTGRSADRRVTCRTSGHYRGRLGRCAGRLRRTVVPAATVAAANPARSRSAKVNLTAIASDLNWFVAKRFQSSPTLAQQ